MFGLFSGKSHILFGELVGQPRLVVDQFLSKAMFLLCLFLCEIGCLLGQLIGKASLVIDRAEVVGMGGLAARLFCVPRYLETDLHDVVGSHHDASHVCQPNGAHD